MSDKKKTKKNAEEKSWFSKNPSWVFHYVDNTYPKWGLKTVEDIYALLDKLSNFETMTWNEIMQASGAKAPGKGNNSHFIDVADLIPEARKCWQNRQLYRQSTQVFSLRLENKERLFGILDDGVFKIVWFDKNHEICPSKK